MNALRHVLPVLIVLPFARACTDEPKTASANHPQYGAWGVDLSSEDTTVHAGDDFFRRVNGGWLSSATIPGDKPGVSLRLLISDTTEARLRAIMETAAATASHEPAKLEGKVGAFYKHSWTDAAVNYCAAGAVIGHELTHGFDDQGRQIDADGTLRDWWQPNDAKTFNERAKAFAAQSSSAGRRHGAASTRTISFASKWPPIHIARDRFG